MNPKIELIQGDITTLSVEAIVNAAIAIKTAVEFLKKHPKMGKVIFVCFDGENFNIYKNILPGIIHELKWP